MYDLVKYFDIALKNLKSVLQSFTGNRRDQISIVIKKSDLDEKIVRFIRQGSMSFPKKK